MRPERVLECFLLEGLTKHNAEPGSGLKHAGHPDTCKSCLAAGISTLVFAAGEIIDPSTVVM